MDSKRKIVNVLFLFCQLINKKKISWQQKSGAKMEL